MSAEQSGNSIYVNINNAIKSGWRIWNYFASADRDPQILIQLQLV